jgi:phenylalanyl-tRNA synthetase alpha chain
MEKFNYTTMQEPRTSLEKAKIAITQENPNLPMQLKFEVSDKETIEKLLAITDLTEPTREGAERNIIGKVFDSLMNNLAEANFPNIQVVRGNPIVSVEDNFNSLLFTPGNPGRSSTYTRYTDGEHVLRTHTSALIPSTFREIAKQPTDVVTLVLPGLAYRRDVIDPRHLDVFHQIDVWTLQKNEIYGKVTRKELLALGEVVFDAACPGAEMIVYEAKHPYTIDGIEVYAKVDGKEIEVFEAGLIHPTVMKDSGINPELYSGLALGMGVERLIMARKNLPDIRLIRSTDARIISQMTNLEKFKQVSNQPAMNRDMSYCVDKNDTEEDICENIKNAFGVNADLLEEVKILSRTSYSDLEPIAKQRLGAKSNQDNVLVRITLRHPDKTLTRQESAKLYDEAYPKLHHGDTSGYTVKK